MTLPLIALPVVYAFGSSWITFHEYQNSRDVAAAFCDSVDGATLNPDSVLPETSASVGKKVGNGSNYVSCFEHVHESLDIRLQQIHAHQYFLEKIGWKWRKGEELSSFSENERNRVSHPLPPLELVHIWIGPAPLPRDYQYLVDKWQHHHSTSKLVSSRIRLLQFESILQVRIQKDISAAIDRDARTYSDVLRLQYLFDNGGIYADVDVWPVRSFNRLVDLARREKAVLFGTESPDVVSNSVIIAPYQNHPFLGFLLRNLCRWAKFHAGMRASKRTGPGFLTSAVRFALKSKIKGVIILDYQTFNPIHFSEVEGNGQLSESVFTRWSEDVNGFNIMSHKNTFAVQGWNSHIAYLPTKIEIKSVEQLASSSGSMSDGLLRDGNAGQSGALVVNLIVYPWIGPFHDNQLAGLDIAGWKVCAQELCPETERVCKKLLPSETTRIPTSIFLPSPRTGIKSTWQSANREVRVWLLDNHGLPQSRSSRSYRVESQQSSTQK